MIEQLYKIYNNLPFWGSESINILLIFLIVSILYFKFKRNDNLINNLKNLTKFENQNIEEFLTQYFGINYRKILSNHDSYDNFIKILLKNDKTLSQILNEKKTLINKLNNKSVNESLQVIINNFILEYKFDDTMLALENFINRNTNFNNNELINAHYQKALIHMFRNDYLKAKKEFEKFIIMNNTNDSYLFYEYACTLHKLIQYDKSITYYKKSLNIFFENPTKENYFYIAKIYNNIGNILFEGKNKEKSIQYYNQALDIFNNHLNKNDYFITYIYNNIARYFENEFEFDKSIDLYTKTLKIYNSYFGKDHKKTININKKIKQIWSKRIVKLQTKK